MPVHSTPNPYKFIPLALASIAAFTLAPACDDGSAESIDLESSSGLPDMPGGESGSDDANGSVPTDEPDPLELESPIEQVPVTTAYITGRVTYKPDFHTLEFVAGPDLGIPMDDSYVGRGRVPSSDSSYSVVRYLFVCAYEVDGSLTDFRSNSEGDDDLLGCARADMFGRYWIPIERSGQDDDVYLVTSFCDNPQAPITVPGTSVTYDDVPEVCIRPNFNVASQSWEDLNEGGGDPEIKYLTTRAHQNILAASGETRISWNLSCPLQDGYKPLDARYDPVICTGSGNGFVEETETALGNESGSVAWTSDTNSNFGHNKEFVHMFVSMMENYRWYGTYKPDGTNALLGGACSSSDCQDPIYVYACDTFEGFTPWNDPDSTPLTPLDDDGFGCGASTSTPSKIYMNHRCPGSLAPLGTCGDLNPHVVTHELGHAMQFRWGEVNGTSDKSTDRGATLEGWADFVALATWYDKDAANSPNTDAPHFNDPTMVAENQWAFSGANWTDDSCGSGNGCGCSVGDLYLSGLYGTDEGESREAMLFWDLYDEATDGGFDTVEIDFGLIRSHWNLFGDLNNDGDVWDDHESKECQPSPDVCPGDDGVNLMDFQWWWDELEPLTGVDSIDTVMTLNCTDKHTAGRNCTDTVGVCNHAP